MNGDQDSRQQQGTWGQSLPDARPNRFPVPQWFNNNSQIPGLQQLLSTHPWTQPGFNLGAFNAMVQQLLPSRGMGLPEFPWLHGGVPPMPPGGILPRTDPTQPQFLGPPVMPSGGNMRGDMMQPQTSMQPFAWLGGQQRSQPTQPQSPVPPVPPLMPTGTPGAQPFDWLSFGSMPGGAGTGSNLIL